MNQPKRPSRHTHPWSQSSNLTQVLVDQDYIGILVLRGADYFIETVNPLICRIWGRTMEETLGRPLFDVLPEIKDQGIESLLEPVLRDGTSFRADEFPTRLMRDGKMETVYFSFTYSPVRGADGTIDAILVLASDVTDQVVAQQALAASREERDRYLARLDELFMQAPALIAVLKGPEHVFEMANQSYKDIVAGSRDIIGSPVHEVFPEVVEQGFIDILDGVYKSGTPWTGTEVLIRIDRDGSGRLLDLYFTFVYQPLHGSDGNVEGIFVHAVEVTDQVKARHESEHLTAQLAATYESMPDGVLIVDQGRIVRANNGIASIFGFDDPTLMMVDVTRLHARLHVRHVDTGKQMTANQSPLLRASKGDVIREEVIITRPNTGDDRILRISAAPIMAASGVVEGAVGIVSDVTREKDLERQKDDFIAIATHELKTPVTSMKTYAQLLQRRFERMGDDEASVMMGRMNQQIDKLTTLIGDLLDVRKIESDSLESDFKTFEFDELVSETVDAMQLTTLRHAIGIRGVTGASVHSDPDRLRQVVINFISNAIKYSPEADRIEVNLSSSGTHVTLKVTDFGVGIPAKYQSRIFKRFYRVGETDAGTFPGLGLGLYISADIIRRLGGEIGVESDGTHGSTFSFTLPIGQP